jgi:hypothetical protein
MPQRWIGSRYAKKNYERLESAAIFPLVGRSGKSRNISTQALPNFALSVMDSNVQTLEKDAGKGDGSAGETGYCLHDCDRDVAVCAISLAAPADRPCLNSGNFHPLQGSQSSGNASYGMLSGSRARYGPERQLIHRPDSHHLAVICAGALGSTAGEMLGCALSG